MNRKEYKCEGEYGKYLYSGDSRYEKIWEQMQLLGIEDVSTMRQEKNGTIAWKLPIKNEWSKLYIEEKYYGDSRYEKVWDMMQLLQIEDISTPRQEKNGTIVWKLPIKNEWNNGSFIEVASFKTGYVRNNNSASSNYQLNKQVDGKPEYYKLSSGDYRKYTSKERVLIPIEIERLEYLISYCLKNYYINHANFVADGEYVPKWRYDNLADAARLDYETRDLENKLDTIKRIANYG